LLLPITFASAQITEFRGQTASGAYYTIAIPTDWQADDGLVIWNHGYQGYTVSSPQANPSLGPFEDMVLAQGFALAASSYSQTGWAVFNSHIDNHQLYEKFVELAAVPEKLFLQGGSLGGIVSVRDLEAGLLNNVDGALLLCGAVAGSENWVQAFDLRLVYEAVCKEVDGARLPTANWYDRPLPILGEIEFLDSVQKCTGLLANTVFDNPLWPLLLSTNQRTRLNEILQLTDTEVEFLLLNLGYAVFELPNLVNDNDKLNGLRPFSNVGIDYGDSKINTAIQRSAALPSARHSLFTNYTPSGNIGETKVISIHTSQDGLVRVENQQTLIDLVPSNQLTVAVAVEESPSHCGFSDTEGLVAWNSLLDWSLGMPQPSAQDIQIACQDLNTAPQQCRYDPDFDIGKSLLTFPRENLAETAAINSFDRDKGLVSIPLIQQSGDSNTYQVELISAREDDTLYDINAIELISEQQDWRHQARFFSQESLLYIPNLRVLPQQENAPSYNVFMKYSNTDQERLQLLEYEPAN